MESNFYLMSEHDPNAECPTPTRIRIYATYEQAEAQAKYWEQHGFSSMIVEGTEVYSPE